MTRISSAFKLLKRVGFAFLVLGAMNLSQAQPEAWHVIYRTELDFFDVHFTDQQHGIATSTEPPVSIYRTNDGGFTWQPLIMWVDFYSDADGIEFYNERIGHLINGPRTAITTDGGANWTIRYHNGQSIDKLAYIDSLRIVAIGNLFWGPDSTLRSIFRSTDGGENWTTVYEEVVYGGFHDVVSLSDSLQVIVSQRGQEVWRSLDQGLSWSLDAYSSNFVTELCSPAPNKIVASGFTLPGHYPAISRSLDGGLTWIDVFADTSLRATIFEKIDFPDALHGWAVGYDGMVAQTNDGGDSWDLYFIDSVQNFLTAVSFIDSSNGWAIDPTGDDGRSCKVVRFGEANPVSPNQPILPTNLEVFSSYPNPFNSSTTIRFALSSTGFTRAKIYNIEGKEVADLLEMKLTAGTHAIQWTPANMPSGLYFLRIEWNNSIRNTQKLIYLK